jgi:hypothetical protein
MLDPLEPCPPAHLPPERLAALGLLTPFACGALVCSFVLLPFSVACVAAFFLFVAMRAVATVKRERSQGFQLRFHIAEALTDQPISRAKIILVPLTEKKRIAETWTDSDGTATLFVICRVVKERMLFWASSSVYYDGWLNIIAPGYAATWPNSLAWHTGWATDFRDIEPQVIRVTLMRPAGMATAGRHDQERA